MKRRIVLLGCALGLLAGSSVSCTETSGLPETPLDEQVNVADGAAPHAPSTDDPSTDDAGSGLAADALPAQDVTMGDGAHCTPDLTGTVRDFHEDHPDFENDAFNSDTGETEIVLPTLGADHKPVYRLTGAGGTKLTTGKPEFDQWYRDVPGINRSFPLKLTLTKGANGLMTYENNEFFPIDGQGFGNEGREHNFSFTFELHTQFQYHGGEVFTFTGDDDLWVFINGKRAIDLGGLHPKLTDTIRLDDRATALGLEKGKTYELSVFHAERHTTASRFRIDTTIEFTNCSAIIR